MGRSCPTHGVPGFDCMDWEGLLVRQVTADGRIEFVVTVGGGHSNQVSNWY